AGLRGADVRRTDLRGADLGGADIRRASLHVANLTEADLRRANLQGAILWETVFANTRLSDATGLDACDHVGPCTLDHRTFERSGGTIPRIFLKRCGWPDALIDYMPSCLSTPLSFASCFISYSTKDEAFASRLHRDFEAAGITCWKWDHHARVGRDIFGEITYAIGKHDRAVLIASIHSLTAPAVDREIERVLQEEDRRAKLRAAGQWKGLPSVLFPVTIDDYIFREDNGLPTWNHPRRADVLRKVVGNAIGWKEDEARYRKILEKLIADLRIGPED
ncbi:MAG: toll/interleukin-1 receptor domain-containing protein, partial [Myxococcales bacterium]|nr:toll/interleukin-1 receptor domain-containing protein [Myxococcales bacterium]